MSDWLLISSTYVLYKLLLYRPCMCFKAYASIPVWQSNRRWFCLGWVVSKCGKRSLVNNTYKELWSKWNSTYMKFIKVISLKICSFLYELVRYIGIQFSYLSLLVRFTLCYIIALICINILHTYLVTATCVLLCSYKEYFNVCLHLGLCITILINFALAMERVYLEGGQYLLKYIPVFL